MNRTKDGRLIVVPEGPVAYDGQYFRYSKGERKYLDNLAQHFGEVIIYAFVQRPGDPFYEACSHSRFEAQNLRIVELMAPATEHPSVLSKAIQFFRILILMMREIKDADFVYLFLPGYPSAMAWLAARYHGKPHFVYAADDWEQATAGMFKWDSLRRTPIYWVFSGLNSFFERRIARSALFSVTAGQALLAKYEKWGVPVAETTPRIVLSRDDMFVRSDTCQSPEVRLLNVGSLVFDKAQHVLIDVIARFRKLGHHNVKLDILGEGPLEDQLKTQVRDHNLEHVITFHGHIQEEADLYEFFRRADVFVLSSVSEGFPRVLYEAMAHCLPIVTTDCGGIPFKMKDGTNAIICPCNSVDALFAGVEKLLEDDELRRRIIDGGRQTIEQVFDKMDPKQIVSFIETTMGDSAAS